MPRAVLHVDLDQFVVAVELRRWPELRGRPVLVGGTGDPTRRGVVAGASYEARARGVRSGTPLRTALSRCPDAVFLPVDREAYLAASAEVMAVLAAQPGPLEQLGWDEAFLAVDAEDPETVARDLQAQVHEATGLMCSVGIGDNRLRAKTATGFGKPAAVFTLTERDWAAVMGPEPLLRAGGPPGPGRSAPEPAACPSGRRPGRARSWSRRPCRRWTSSPSPTPSGWWASAPSSPDRPRLLWRRSQSTSLRRPP